MALERDNLNLLTKHRNKRTREGPYICGDCGKIFLNKFLFDYHVKKRHKPYKCEICAKAFSVEETLTRHMKIHNREKPFQCRHCGKAFSYDSSLKIHMRIHSGIRSNQCKSCGEVFIDIKNLLRHIYSQHCELNDQNDSEAVESYIKDIDPSASNTQHGTDQTIYVLNTPSNSINVKADQMDSETDSAEEPKVEIKEENIYVDTSDADFLIEPKIEIKEEQEDIIVQTGIVMDLDKSDISSSPLDNFYENSSNEDLYNPCKPDTIILLENCNQYYEAYQSNSRNQDPLSLNNYTNKEISSQYNQSKQSFHKNIYSNENVVINTGQIPYQSDQSEEMLSPEQTIAQNKKILPSSEEVNIRLPGSEEVKISLPTGKKLYQCTQCKNIFLNVEYLINHMKTHGKEIEQVNIPNEAKLYQCNKCNIVFLNNDCLTIHMKTHTQEKERVTIPFGKKLHQCKQCKKVFLNIEYLTQHMETHTQEKKHVTVFIEKKVQECKVCKEKFLNMEYLTRHMKTHSKCSHCDMIFANNDILIRHINNINEHTKTSCGKSGTLKPVSNHMKTHTQCQEKPCKCMKCDMIFANDEILKRHIHKEHIKTSCGKSVAVKPASSGTVPPPHSSHIPNKPVCVYNPKTPNLIKWLPADFVSNVPYEITNKVKTIPDKYTTGQIKSAEVSKPANVDSDSNLTHDISKIKNVCQQGENDKSDLKTLNMKKDNTYTSKHKKAFKKSWSKYYKIYNQNNIKSKITLKQQIIEDKIKGAEIVNYNKKFEKYPKKNKTTCFKTYLENFSKEDTIKGVNMVSNQLTFYNHELGKNITDQELYEHMRTKYAVKKVQVGVGSSRFNSFCQFPKDLVDFHQSKVNSDYKGKGHVHPLHQYYYDKYIYDKKIPTNNKSDMHFIHL